MGVPKFFRYTSERYPCLNELVKQYQIPDFDNMYLDMNGIIHNCSHPDDSNPHFRITEEKIFEDIFHYLSVLFQIIKPKKLFFMAIDGVAPRAKMNQQRGRRFRTAREAEKLEEEARSKGEKLPSEKRFDSNCITPGTVFMARLHEQLRFFVKQKMSTDPAWSKVKVILSGHETPGEGEHKIMDYIRWARSQPDYDPNTRHCLYGLDADLIMLGMCTHEPHFALLREEVKFGKTTQRATSPEDTNFYLLHLSLLREYLEQEFISIKDKLPFEYDLEKIVDDWVLMGFLVGNDFIPNLPNMHINNDALPLLYKTYLTVLPTLDGYINEAGDLNLARFETFMQELAKIDREKFQDTYTDLKYFEAKTGRRPNANERREYKPNNDDTFNVNIDDIKANKPDDELQALIDATQDMCFDGFDNDEEDGYEETSDEEANIEMEFILHKKDYYMNKLDYSKVNDEVLLDQATCYVRAIQWNLWYYYRGCASWCWFYPHHYAPYISDIRGFHGLKIEFELGEPFKPFEQLLAVLPAASKHLLPAPFHDLMTDEDSPIVHYYPVNFETDLNGKRNDWEAVVLIPFIDEVNLLSAMSPCYQRLTEEELRRNSHGPMLMYDWTPQNLGTVLAPEYFPAIAECHAVELPIWRSDLDVPVDLLKRGMLPNAQRDLVYPGFPTMKHLKYTTTLKKNKVKVFDQPSRNENMIIRLAEQKYSDATLEQCATEILGRIVWVGWPHLTKAKVISVSNEKMRLHHIDKQNSDMNGAAYTTEVNHGNLHKQWISERSTIIEHNMNRLGIELGDVNMIVHAVNHKGYKYVIQDGVHMVQQAEFCSIPCGYPAQAVLTDVSEHVVKCSTKFTTVKEAFPAGEEVMLLAHGPYYAAVAKVVESENIRSGRIKVQVKETTEPTTIRIATKTYKNANHAAAACGLSPQLLSRVTGSVLVVSGQRHKFATEQLSKVNIGLNLKFNKKNQEVAGYTLRCKVSNQWMYSDRCIELVKEYSRRYPELFDNLAYSLNQDVFFESDLWPKEMCQKKPQEVQAWLKTQPHVTAARRECGSEALEPDECKLLLEHIQEQMIEKKEEKKVTLNIKWNLLYKPELHSGNIQPDPLSDYKLLDRVVCCSRTISAPFAARGTIVAVHTNTELNTVRLSDKLNSQPTYEVMFDEPFPGGMTETLFEEPRFYRMQSTALLNISYGRKLRNSQSNNSQDVRALSFTPNLLRRDDGHHSAFASYSPPGESKPIEKSQPAAKPASSNGAFTEDPTNLLKSLLKISESDVRRNALDQQRENRQYQPKSYNQVPPPSCLDDPSWPPFPGAQTNQNWRQENHQYTPARPNNYHEWTNTALKNQPPLPPFPSFSKPGPASVPFPQFSDVPQQNKHQQNNINNAVALTPAWAQGPKLSSSSDQPTDQSSAPASSTVSNNSARVTYNPFVPLQVQTSRRRNQNTGSTNPPRSQQQATIQNQPTQPPQQPQNAEFKQWTQPSVQENQNPNRYQQRKRRPRIAANLPFQTD